MGRLQCVYMLTKRGIYIYFEINYDIVVMMELHIVFFVCLFGIHATYANVDGTCDAFDDMIFDQDFDPDFDTGIINGIDNDMITDHIQDYSAAKQPTAWPTCAAICPAFVMDLRIEFVPTKYITGALPNFDFFDVEQYETAGREATSGAAETSVDTDFICYESGICELVKDFNLDSPRLTRHSQGRLQKPGNGHKAMSRSKESVTDSKPSNHDSQLDGHHFVQESVTDQGQGEHFSTGPTPGLSQWFIINPLMIGDILMTTIWILFCYYFALPASDDSRFDEDVPADFPTADEPHKAPALGIETYLFELYRLYDKLNQPDEVVILNKIKDQKKQLKQNRKLMKREVSELLRRVERLTEELSDIRDKNSSKKISSPASAFTISFIPNFLKRVYNCSKDKFITRTMKHHDMGPGSSVDPA